MRKIPPGESGDRKSRNAMEEKKQRFMARGHFDVVQEQTAHGKRSVSFECGDTLRNDILLPLSKDDLYPHLSLPGFTAQRR
jgi:hypothetical protein